MMWLQFFARCAMRANPTFTGTVTLLGGQLKFPATPNLSTDPNTLDDYEEGTWTPTDASGAGLTLTVTYATYTKIGRLPTVRCLLTYPATASGLSALLSGLPFSCGNQGWASINTGSAVANGVAISGTGLTLATGHGGGVTNAQMSGAFVIVTAVYEV